MLFSFGFYKVNDYLGSMILALLLTAAAWHCSGIMKYYPVKLATNLI
jgi:hypothetical protein